MNFILGPTTPFPNYRCHDNEFVLESNYFFCVLRYRIPMRPCFVKLLEQREPIWFWGNKRKTQSRCRGTEGSQKGGEERRGKVKLAEETLFFNT